MKVYLDANWYVRLYLHLGNAEAMSLMNSKEGRKAWPFPVTRLLRMEIENALQRMVFESRESGQWRITPEVAALALADFEEDLEKGILLREAPISLDELAPEYRNLVARHTARHGFRTYDVLHVASARLLHCRGIWTFDVKARQLAQLEGFVVNPMN